MKPKYILMLEDDPDDRYITETVLKELGIELPLHFFPDSDRLFAFLSHHPEPALILVDYNLEPENGLSILKKIKSDAAFRHLPVVILSDSGQPRYVRDAYAAGAGAFVVKPSSDVATREKIQLFFRYWLDVAEV